MHFSDVLRGTRATRAVTLTLSDGAKVACAVRVLHPDLEVAAILDEAGQRAASDGAEMDGDRGRARWVWALTVARAVVDPNSDPLELFFDGGVTQVLERLDEGRIRFLYSAQVAWQREAIAVASKRASELLWGITKPGPAGPAAAVESATPLHPLVVAARYARELHAFYGAPAVTLTSDQIWAWQDLTFEHYERFERNKK